MLISDWSADVGSSDLMRAHLGIPDGWGPKLVQHSMASELRKRRVDPWELSGQLGHRVLKTSEISALYDPDYLDRKRVVSGTRVYVRVGLGVRRSLKKKNHDK